jgi:SEC-C motif
VHFERALEADAEFGPAIDRAAWYASDRGDARRAADLWRMLESPDEGQLRAAEDALERVPSRHGRNDPCWCGSGRKQKVCHGDDAEPIPLADRVPWLGTKAVAYLFRHGGEADLDLFDLAIAHASEPDDIEKVKSALDDVAVADVALTELGWFEGFLRDRGPLLPDDERDLAARWLDVERSVYEVEPAGRDGAVALRDLRTGERLEVGAPTPPIAQWVCARAVPDGAGHQLFGAVFAVEPDDVDEVVALCANHDAFGLCGYAGRNASG